MLHAVSKPITNRTSDDSQTCPLVSQVEGKCWPPATRGTWLDSASPTCTGTSTRESGLSSFEPHMSGDSDSSSTQPILPRAKTRQRPDGSSIIGRHGQAWKTKRSERNSAVRRLQQQVHWLSDRLDGKCWEFSKLQIEVYRLRGELRDHRYGAKTGSRASGGCVSVDVIVNIENAELPCWQDADEASWGNGDTVRAWMERVCPRTT